MAPQLAKLAKTHGDKVVVLKVDVMRHGAMAQKAGVRGIPDTRLLHGGREVARQVGGLPYQVLEGMVLKNVALLPPVAEATGQPLVRKTAPGPQLPGGIVRQAPPLTPEQKEAKKDSIVPMKEDWLPPGVTPQ